MSSERKGDWMQVASGIAFWPLDPRPEEILLEDIALSLSNMCRFGGHVPKGFYSVAQHCVLVSLHVQEEAAELGLGLESVRILAATGLMHDAPEAYLVDVPRPLKRHLQGYRDIEDRIAYVMGKKYELPLADLPELVKRHDERALMTEKRDLLAPPPLAWTSVQGHDVQPWPEILGAYWNENGVPRSPPGNAYSAFLKRAAELGIR